MLKTTSFIQRCALVRSIPVFAFLNWYRIQLIARQAEVIEHKKGEAVSRKGTAPDYVYFLISGRLQSYTFDRNGSKEDLEFIHRGMFFGIISALTGEDHSQTFEAINDSVLLRIPVHKFRRILKLIPDLGLKFSKTLSQRIRNKMTRTEMVPKSTIISVYAPVSGSGGSTYVANLSMSLAREAGEKVVWVSIRSRNALGQAVETAMDEIRPKWKIEPRDIAALVHDFEGILHHVTRSETGPDFLNVTFNPDDRYVVDHISAFVSRFIDEYRYVIVDLPSDMDAVVMKTLGQSDYIHLLLQRKREALENGRAVLDRIESLLKEEFNEERVKVIIAGVNAHRNIPEDAVRQVLDFDIACFLPYIQRKDLGPVFDGPAVAFTALLPTCPYARYLARLARQISGVSVGLVLGGGAAFGLAHIGVLKVLEEEGIGVDIIAGSSMGALIGSLWAVGYRAEEIAKMAGEFKKRSNLIKLVDLVFPLSGLISGKAVMSWLYNKFGKRTFRDARIPVKVVAYDLLQRRDVVIENGSIVEAVRKSISIPGVFQPIISRDQLIIDGGVMNPLPTNVLADANIKRIIAVNVLQSPEDVIKGYQKTQKALEKAASVSFVEDPIAYISIQVRFWISRRFFPNISDIIVRTLEASESVIAEQSSRYANIVIHPDLAGLNWYELYKADELIKRGEDAARRHLEALRRIARTEQIKRD